MEKIIKKLNEDLLNGTIPNELNFSQEKAENDLASFNWDMVKYNTFYKDKKYILGKYPKGFDTLPCFEKILESIAEKIDPLEEMLERIDSKVSNNNI